MDISIFLPNLHSKRIKDYLAHIDHVHFHFMTYDTLEQLNDQFQKVKGKVDAYLFSGRLSYLHMVSIEKEFDKPTSYLQMSEADFFKQLFLFSVNHPSFDFSRAIIDFTDENPKIKSFIDQLDDKNKPYILKAPNQFTDSIYDEGFWLHKQIHDEGKADISFTRIINILPQFIKNEIPHYYLEISKETIISQVNELIDMVEIENLKDNQIVLGFLTFSVNDSGLKESKALYIHSLLLEYNYLSKNYLNFDRVDHHFELTTNLSSLKEMTHSFAMCELISFLSKKESELIIHIGWGTGTTYKQAEIHAKRALELSKSNLVSSTFICKESNQMIGPLRMQTEDTTDIQKWLVNANLSQIRNQSNLSEDRFNKVILAFDEAGLNQLTSVEFAEILQLSVRSANRILKEAELNHLVHATFEKSAGMQGRPRKVYSLNKELFID